MRAERFITSTSSRLVPGLPGIELFCATGSAHRYGRHSHSGYAIGVFEHGAGGTVYRGSSHVIAAGEIVAMNPDEPHTGYAATSRMSYRMFYIEPGAVRDMIGSAGMPSFSDIRVRRRGASGRLLRLHRMLSSSDDALANQCRADAVLSEFLAAGAAGERPRDRAEPAAVARVKDFLRANWQRNVDGDELAAEVQLNRSYLIRAFAAAVGMPPHEWLVQIRVERARALLRAGVPIARVALETGFSDQSHFTRHFKSLTGMTPGAFAAGHNRARREAGEP